MRPSIGAGQVSERESEPVGGGTGSDEVGEQAASASTTTRSRRPGRRRDARRAKSGTKARLERGFMTPLGSQGAMVFEYTRFS
jgi:hypothetical protein